MQYSGILVAAPPDALDAVCERVEALEGLEVHQVDRETGRLVVVHEAPTLGAQRDGLRALQELPGVLFAELVYHFVDDETEREPAG